MPAVGLDERVAAIERLTALFRLERIVYLWLTSISLVLLLISAGVLIWSSHASPATLTFIFGSSGLMAISIARLLRMWERAFDLLQSDVGGTD